MEHLKFIIDKNPNAAFVVWMKNYRECKMVYQTLKDLGYECTIPIKPLEVMWGNMCKASNYQFGVRIRPYAKDCAFNESLKHWMDSEYNILGFVTEDKLDFINMYDFDF